MNKCEQYSRDRRIPEPKLYHYWDSHEEGAKCRCGKYQIVKAAPIQECGWGIVKCEDDVSKL